jgi:NitT/TauT family transport system substrate-binding protein
MRIGSIQQRLGRTLLLVALCPFVASIWGGTAAAAEKLVFGTSWLPVAESGGFYQALADGTYAEYGIDVDLKSGGPQVNTMQLLAAGSYDLAISFTSLGPLNLVNQGAPNVAVAAFFQKEPIALMAHAEADYKELSDLKGHPILVATDSIGTFWQFLKLKYGFTDSQMRPYTFNLAPFLSDKSVIQQCYATNEPEMLAEQGVKTKVFLLADHGYPSYGQILTTSRKLVKEKPALVQRFVDASKKGWATFLHGDASKARAMILKDNPDYTEKNFEISRAAMIKYGIVETGDTAKLGIGAMTDDHWKDFADTMIKAGVYPSSLDVKSAYTLQFVDKARAKDN